MTIAEMISNLMTMPPDNQVEIFGCTSFILRERNDPKTISPPSEWLELDARD
jgi:hypothetical protein